MTPFIGQLKLSPGTFFGVTAVPDRLYRCRASSRVVRSVRGVFGIYATVLRLFRRRSKTRGGRLKIEEIVSNAKRETRSPKENRFARRRRLLFLLEIPRLDSETRRRWWFIFCVDRPVKINRPIVFSTSRLGSFVLPFVSSFVRVSSIFPSRQIFLPKNLITFQKVQILIII